MEGKFSTEPADCSIRLKITHFLSCLPLYYTHCVRFDLDISTICHRKMRKIETNHCLEKWRKTKLLFTHQVTQLDRVFPKFCAYTANFSHQFASEKPSIHSFIHIFFRYKASQIIFYSDFCSRSHSLNCSTHTHCDV